MEAAGEAERVEAEKVVAAAGVEAEAEKVVAAAAVEAEAEKVAAVEEGEGREAAAAEEVQVAAEAKGVAEHQSHRGTRLAVKIVVFPKVISSLVSYRQGYLLLVVSVCRIYCRRVYDNVDVSHRCMTVFAGAHFNIRYRNHR